MFTAQTLKVLAVVTGLLFAVAALLGDGDVLYVVDDVVWFGFLLSLLTLVVVTVGVLARASRRR